ncbi:MAG: sigma-70 family RNA polymerase sigma factor [Butyricicoccus sp.]|nr:sigma-70 family RNA polymerase sigma factor [Butyricicoccus sp.]
MAEGPQKRTKEGDSMDDAAIIGLYWERSEGAIETTQEKYGARCFCLAWNILRSDADSEECVNDTWLRAWDAMPPEWPEKLGAFLGRITRNLALDRLKKRESQKRGGGRLELALSELEECVPSGDDPARRADELTLRELLDRFLASLGEDARLIFLRRYWYMLSVEEVARSLGASRSKVKSSLLRSREKLRAMLEKEGFTL